ncbi:hypothetical protein N7539_006988, partial [Penicillium diatomitis]
HTKTLRLLRGKITPAIVKDKDTSILHELSYRNKRFRFFTHLYRNERNPAKKLIARFPLTYWIGEDCPGNADEKVRCGTSTYAWLEKDCATAPNPQLYSFGLSDGETFTFLDNLPIFTRTIKRLRRWLLSLLSYPATSRYSQHPTEGQLKLCTPYLLIKYINPSRGPGKVLSET